MDPAQGHKAQSRRLAAHLQHRQGSHINGILVAFQGSHNNRVSLPTFLRRKFDREPWIAHKRHACKAPPPACTDAFLATPSVRPAARLAHWVPCPSQSVWPFPSSIRSRAMCARDPCWSNHNRCIHTLFARGGRER